MDPDAWFDVLGVHVSREWPAFSQKLIRKQISLSKPTAFEWYQICIIATSMWVKKNAPTSSNAMIYYLFSPTSASRATGHFHSRDIIGAFPATTDCPSLLYGGAELLWEQQQQLSVIRTKECWKAFEVSNFLSELRTELERSPLAFRFFRSLNPSTSCTTSVRADSSIDFYRDSVNSREILVQALWPLSVMPEILKYIFED